MTMAGVPPGVVAEYKPYLSNMLGLIRGNIYYNLISWYRCLTCLPVGDTSKYMETMMGVKQVRENSINRKKISQNIVMRDFYAQVYEYYASQAAIA